MKVYVGSELWQFDSGECGNELKVFSDLEKALNWLKERKEQALVDMEGFSGTESEESAMVYSIWEEGNYCYNHIDIKVVELEVE